MQHQQLHRFVLLACALQFLYTYAPARASAMFPADTLAAAQQDTLPLPVNRAWTRYVLRRDDLRLLPYRTTLEAFSLFPSVVIQSPGSAGPAALPYFDPHNSYDGARNPLTVRPLGMGHDGLHVRGGRTREIAYFLDGIPTTNRYFNAPMIDPIPEAVENVELHVGPYSVAYGQGLSGLSMTRLRTGGEKFEVSAEFNTDNLARNGEEFLGTSTFGYQSAVATLGGPIPILDTLRFFVAGRHFYQRDRQAMFLKPFRFENLQEDRYGVPGRPLPGPLAFSTNTVPHSWIEENSLQGNLTLGLDDACFQFTGAYRSVDVTSGSGWPYGLFWYYDQQRVPEDRERSALLGLSVRTRMSATTFDATFSWQRSWFDTYEPDFGNDWRLYTDSVANAAIGHNNFRSRWRGPDPYSVIFGFPIANEHSPWSRYRKDEQQAWIFTGEMNHRFDDNFTLRAGVEAEWWTMRLFEIPDLPARMEAEFGAGGTTPRGFSDEQTRRVALGRIYEPLNTFGFSVDGTIVDGGFDAPRTPFFGSTYAMLQYSGSGFALNAGLRYEHIALKMPVPEDPGDIPFNPYAGIIDESRLVEQEPQNYLLPRIDLSYSPGPYTVISAAYGQYVGVPALSQLYFGSLLLSRTVSAWSGGSPYLTPVGWQAKPERCAQFEIGIAHHFTPLLSFNLALYSKSYSDLLAVRKLTTGKSGQGVTAYSNALLNDAYADARGIEADLDWEHSSGLFGRLLYALSATSGTDSYPLSALGQVEAWDGWSSGTFRQIMAAAPMDYQQTHRGTAILGYSAPIREDDQLLTGIELSVIFSFSSGHPYTRHLQVMGTGGMATPWNVGVSDLLDPRFSYPAEPLNESRTPSALTIDLAFSKEFVFGPVKTTIVLEVLNLANHRAELNAYPRTGTSTDDGWLDSEFAANYTSVPGYTDFYRTINLANRWAYMSVAGYDMYNHPRQIRLGMRVVL
jgi:hypothetical protein